MTHTFKCGHSAEEPRFLGRGKARERRLREYFDRVCLSCALASSEKNVRSLTDLQGNPRTEYYYRVTIAEHAESVKRRY